MTEKIDVIRRLRAGQSIRGINRETDIHRATIRIVRDIAFSIFTHPRVPPAEGNHSLRDKCQAIYPPEILPVLSIPDNTSGHYRRGDSGG